MERAAIGFPRWTRKAVFSAAGGSYNATYPVTNLQSEQLSFVARTTGVSPSQTKFQAVLDKPRPVRVLAFVNHNASLDATYRIRLYADAAMTSLLYDSGAAGMAFWPSVYPPGQLEWEDDGFWFGKYSQDEIAGYRAIRPIWLDKIYLARAALVEVFDDANPAGYFQCGLFEIAAVWQFGVNFAFGSEYGFEARTDAARALGGAEYFLRNEKPRVFRGQIKLLDRDEALAKAFELQRQHDIDEPFLWLPNPESTQHLLRECFLARQAELGLMSYMMYARDGAPIFFREVL